MAAVDEGRNPPTSRVHAGASSTDDGPLAKLQNNIENAMLHRDLPELRFVPESALRQLMDDPEAMIKILQELERSSLLRREIKVEELGRFITKDAYKVFAMLAWKCSPYLIEHFYGCGFQQTMLPARCWREDGKCNVRPYLEGAQSEEEARVDTLARVFFNTEHPWNYSIVDDFCVSWQWPFLAPVFVRTTFRYQFPPSIHLPFTGPGRHHGDDSSQYSWMEERTIHKAHLQTDLQTAKDNDGNPRVAVKKLKSTDLAEAGREAVALEKINGLKSNHLIKAIAYFQKGNYHYFMFPWAEKGNLWEFWNRQAGAPTTDYKYIVRLFRQLKGLACALEELSEANIRHGDLKPENILCFQEDESLPEGDGQNPSAAVRLVITDVGLARVHVNSTNKRGVTDTAVATMRYAGPELGPNNTGKLSRRFDVWSMGCIFLEFLIWLLYGPNTLIDFSTTPTDRTEKFKFYENMTEHQNLQVPNKETQGSARVHHRVTEWISNIEGDARCPEGTALRRLLDLVTEKLLIVELGDIEPPASQGPGEYNRGSEDLAPNTEKGTPGLRTPSAPFPSGTTTRSPGREGCRVYAGVMKDELVEILDGLENWSLKPIGDVHPNGTLVVRAPSEGKTGGLPSGSADNRVGR